MLLCVVLCCCVLFHVAVCCSMLLCVVSCCCVLFHVAECCSMLLCVVSCCFVFFMLSHVVLSCFMLLHLLHNDFSVLVNVFATIQYNEIQKTK